MSDPSATLDIAATGSVAIPLDNTIPSSPLPHHSLTITPLNLSPAPAPRPRADAVVSTTRTASTAASTAAAALSPLDASTTSCQGPFSLLNLVSSASSTLPGQNFTHSIHPIQSLTIGATPLLISSTAESSAQIPMACSDGGPPPLAIAPLKGQAKHQELSSSEENAQHHQGLAAAGKALKLSRISVQATQDVPAWGAAAAPRRFGATGVQQPPGPLKMEILSEHIDDGFAQDSASPVSSPVNVDGMEGARPPPTPVSAVPSLPLAFRCPEPGCPKAFPTLAALVRHAHGHSGVRGYPCTLCDSKFRCASHLKRHTRNHTNTRPYACNACSKAYADHNNLIYHQVVHHNALPYTCGWPTCSAAFPQERLLREHIASVHGVVALRANGRARFTFGAEKQRNPQDSPAATGLGPGPNLDDQDRTPPPGSTADGTPRTPGSTGSSTTASQSTTALMRASLFGPYAINTPAVLVPLARGQLPNGPTAPHQQIVTASNSSRRMDRMVDMTGDSAAASNSGLTSLQAAPSSGQAVAPPRRSELPDSETPTRKRRLPDPSDPAPHRMPAPGNDSYEKDLNHGRGPGHGQVAEDDEEADHHGQSGASGDAGTRYLPARSVNTADGEPQSRALVVVPTPSSTGSHAHAPLPRPASRSRWIVPRAATSPPAAFTSRGQVLPSHDAPLAVQRTAAHPPRQPWSHESVAAPRLSPTSEATHVSSGTSTSGLLVPRAVRGVGRRLQDALHVHPSQKTLGAVFDAGDLHSQPSSQGALSLVGQQVLQIGDAPASSYAALASVLSQRTVHRNPAAARPLVDSGPDHVPEMRSDASHPRPGHAGLSSPARRSADHMNRQHPAQPAPFAVPAPAAAPPGPTWPPTMPDFAQLYAYYSVFSQYMGGGGPPIRPYLPYGGASGPSQFYPTPSALQLTPYLTPPQPNPFLFQAPQSAQQSDPAAPTPEHQPPQLHQEHQNHHDDQDHHDHQHLPGPPSSSH